MHFLAKKHNIGPLIRRFLFCSIYPNCVPEQNRFSVVAEPPTLSLSRDIPGPLWAGIDQEMVLTIFTGSFSVDKVRVAVKMFFLSPSCCCTTTTKVT
jgi:hypothetical protein